MKPVDDNPNEESSASQCAQILEWLKAGNSITPAEAYVKFQCLRLGARIFNLKERGHKIKTELITLPNGKRVGKYTLIELAENCK